MKILLCLYTCAADAAALQALEATPLLETVRQSTRFEVITVTADPALEKAAMEPTRIVVPCPEDYRSLSVKTHLMIQAALARPFDFLVKVDSTLATYSARPQAKSVEDLARLSPAAALSTLQDEMFFRRPYHGLVQQLAHRDGFERWLNLKGIHGNYLQVFPDGAPTPPYFLGKLYSLRRDVCEFIAAHGADMALEHQTWLGGSEDLMIGRLYRRWQEAQPKKTSLIRRALYRLGFRA